LRQRGGHRGLLDRRCAVNDCSEERLQLYSRGCRCFANGSVYVDSVAERCWPKRPARVLLRRVGSHPVQCRWRGLRKHRPRSLKHATCSLTPTAAQRLLRRKGFRSPLRPAKGVGFWFLIPKYSLESGLASWELSAHLSSGRILLQVGRELRKPCVTGSSP
jgi:hypothetical protein